MVTKRMGRRRQLCDRPLHAAEVARIVVRTPAATVQPLTHHRPRTGLEGKFSLEYALAAALLDDYPGLSGFTDEAAGRAAARELVERVETHLTPDGSGLLAGELELELVLTDGTVRRAAVALPPGAPDRPPIADQLHRKTKDCAGDRHPQLAALTWPEAPGLHHEALQGQHRPGGTGKNQKTRSHW
ncbi:MAG TPA: hypothetical protein VFB84_00795 [Micromonosporaceae bacterium]|nr:hypothetical protein [Micromonosporaceae bacterium]